MTTINNPAQVRHGDAPNAHIMHQMQASRKPTVSEQVSKPRNSWMSTPEGRRAKE